MRYPSRRQLNAAIASAAPRARATQATVYTIPAPIGGLNGRDALDDMPETDAVKMVNCFPGFGRVTVRPGSSLHATVGESGFTASTLPVETLAEWHGPADRGLLAASNGYLYEVTLTGETSTKLSATQFSNDRWQHVNTDELVVIVNGANTPQQWDGGAAAVDVDPAISGVTSSALVNIYAFKNRIYYIPINSQDFWYTAVNAHSGALTVFPLGEVGNFGGRLELMTSITKDGGSGEDDLAVFVMSSGEVLVYAGSDPGDAELWALVGIYQIGAPLGRRAATKVGGDVLIATTDGPVLLSQVLPGGRGAPAVKVQSKLGSIIPDQARLTGSSFGWQFFRHPAEQLALLNYPTGGLFEQYVVNLQTGAWGGPFRGWNASAWALFDDRAYFGGPAGTVVQAWSGVADQGASVFGEVQPAFNYLRNRNRNKQVTMVSPLVEAAAAVDVEIGLSADFSERPQETVTTELGTAGGVQTPWDSPWGSPWSVASRVVEAWIAHEARGYAISPSIRLEQKDQEIGYSAIRIAYHQVQEII